MKKDFVAFAALFLLLLFISACKKNDSTPSPQNLRLIAVVSKGPVDSVRLDYYYDSQGRISKITSKTNADPAVTFFDVSYAGNQIVVAMPAINLSDRHTIDTTYLSTDANGHVTKRIYHFFGEYFAPHNPERAWYADTSTYTYNSDGLLSSKIISTYDTVWYNDGVSKSSVVFTHGTATYTTNSANLVQSFEADQIHQVDRTPTTINAFDKSNEITRTFDYAQSYSNKLDFTNEAIQNEVNWLTEVPVNKSYKNLPNKVSRMFVIKENGAITGTYPSETIYQFTFNGDGLVSSMSNSEQGTVYTYIYGKP